MKRRQSTSTLVEHVIGHYLTGAAFWAVDFAILRYAVGAGHVLAAALAYVGACVALGFSDLRKRL